MSLNSLICIEDGSTVYIKENDGGDLEISSPAPRFCLFLLLSDIQCWRHHKHVKVLRQARSMSSKTKISQGHRKDMWIIEVQKLELARCTKSHHLKDGVLEAQSREELHDEKLDWRRGKCRAMLPISCN
jgi:hypothetical protein